LEQVPLLTVPANPQRCGPCIQSRANWRGRGVDDGAHPVIALRGKKVLTEILQWGIGAGKRNHEENSGDLHARGGGRPKE